jgi:hypothetical protein
MPMLPIHNDNNAKRSELIKGAASRNPDPWVQKTGQINNTSEAVRQHMLEHVNSTHGSIWCQYIIHSKSVTLVLESEDFRPPAGWRKPDRDTINHRTVMGRLTTNQADRQARTVRTAFHTGEARISTCK